MFIITIFIILIFVIFIFLKKFFSKNTKIIILTGAIGVGKTTFTKNLKEYLNKKEKSVYIFEETSLEIKPALDIFYNNMEKHALFMQTYIILYFEKQLQKIQKNMQKYDVIIFDRTHLDTKIFTKSNIKNEDEINFLNKLCDSVQLPFELTSSNTIVIYFKPNFEKMIKRQKNRDRDGEKCNEEYLKKIYKSYNEMISEIYPSHISFENNDNILYNNQFINEKLENRLN